MKKEVIPCVMRDEGSLFGIRAHPEMTYLKCLYSVVLWWQNEFVSIWLYLAFALFFWIQCFMIIGHSSVYDFNNEEDFDLMFIATIGIAISLSLTVVYLTFYSLGKAENHLYESINYMGLLTLAYLCTFACVGGELQGTGAYFYLLLTTVILLGASLILVHYDKGRLIGLIITGVWVGVLFFDGLGNSTKSQMMVFFVPVILEGLFLGIGFILIYFRVPERWFKENRFIQLYVTSQIIYALLFINFVYELHCILYFTLKLNSGNLKDEQAWWKINNIYYE